MSLLTDVQCSNKILGSLSWTEATCDSINKPSSRVGHSLVYFEGSLYLFGGKDDYSASNELWQYHIEAHIWTKLLCPGRKPPRLNNHKAVLYDRKIFVFGGSLASIFSLLVFDFDVYGWEVYRPHGSVYPSGRHSHSVAVYNSMLYMYGGYNSLGTESNELWMYDLDANVWKEMCKEVETRPLPLFGHSAVFCGSVMWLYGGTYNRDIQNSLWSFDTETLVWHNVQRMLSPPELYYHIALVIGDVMVIYGGMTECLDSYSGMWSFNFETEEWTEVISNELPALTAHAVSYVKPTNLPSEESILTTECSPIKQEMSAMKSKRLNKYNSNNITVYSGDDSAIIEIVKLPNANKFVEIELRPMSNHSTTSACSNDSHYSLPGMVDDDDIHDNTALQQHNENKSIHSDVINNNMITAFSNTQSFENSEDSGSQGSRSSLRKKSRGCGTEFYIAGHGPDPLSKHMVLYHCKIG